MTQRLSRLTVCLLVVAVALAFMPLLTQDFATAKTVKAKKITLQASAKTITVGATTTVKVKTIKPKNAAKKVTWKITKGKAYAQLKSAKAASVKVVAKKPGTVTVQAIAKSNKKVKATVKIKINEAAATIYSNGKFYTVEGEGWADAPKQAMAVSSKGTILAIGTTKAVNAYKGKKTAVVDVGGKAVYPGFIDSHVHPPGVAMTELFEIDMYGLNHKDLTLAAIEKFINEHPEMTEYYGDGFNMGFIDVANDIPKQWLDDICADKPIVLTSYDGHSRWLNSKALEICNITKDTEATPGGRIQLTPDGTEPNGIVTDCSPLITLHAEYTDEQWRQGMAHFAHAMNGWGYTSCSTGGNSALKQAVDMDNEGLLTMRINYSSSLDPADVEGSIAKLEELAAYAESSKNVKVGAMKFFCDGVIEGATGYLLEPYTEGAGMGEGWTSAPKVTEDVMKEAMKAITNKGYQIHVHAIGDAAVRQTLNCIEYAEANTTRTDLRPAITHLQLVSDQDKPRFGQLGVISIFQPYWFLKEPWWYEPVDELVLGPDRAYYEYPAKSLIDNGAVPTASGDYPVSEENNPFLAIEAGVTRNLNSGDYYGVDEITDIDDPTWLLNPAERLPVSTLIEAYTINGAYQMFEEDTTGSLKAGKQADFIILDQDPVTVNPLKIDSTKVLETYKGGVKVYDAAAE